MQYYCTILCNLWYIQKKKTAWFSGGFGCNGDEGSWTPVRKSVRKNLYMLSLALSLTVLTPVRRGINPAIPIYRALALGRGFEQTCSGWRSFAKGTGTPAVNERL